MNITIKVNLDNAAFSLENEDGEHQPELADGSELARVLEDLAKQVYGTDCEAGQTFTARDVNGNKVLTADIN